MWKLCVGCLRVKNEYLKETSKPNVQDRKKSKALEQTKRVKKAAHSKH